jgi:hypothetical protein
VSTVAGAVVVKPHVVATTAAPAAVQARLYQHPAASAAAQNLSASHSVANAATLRHSLSNSPYIGAGNVFRMFFYLIIYFCYLFIYTKKYSCTTTVPP